jgi:hypothetical protein
MYSELKLVEFDCIWVKNSSVSCSEIVRSREKYHFWQSMDDIFAVILKMFCLHIGHVCIPFEILLYRHHGCILCLQHGSVIVQLGFTSVQRQIGHSLGGSVSWLIDVNVLFMFIMDATCRLYGKK